MFKKYLKKLKQYSLFEKMQELTLRILVLGDIGNRKAKLITKYVEGYFPESLISTIGVEYKCKLIKIGKFSISLHIWATSGDGRYRSYSNGFIYGVDGIFFVYDITNILSFSFIKERIDELFYKNENERCKSILCGDYLELEHERKVLKESLEKYGLKRHIPTFEISSETGHNLNEAFEKLVNLIMEGKTDEELIEQYSKNKPKNLSKGKKLLKA